MFLIKKILQSIGTLLTVALIVFLLYRLMPGDVVDNFMPSQQKITSLAEQESYENTYQEKAELLNLDKPVFYFSAHLNFYPDTLYQVVCPRYKSIYTTYLNQENTFESVRSYIFALRSVEQKIYEMLPDTSLRLGQQDTLRFHLQTLQTIFLSQNKKDTQTKINELVENSSFLVPLQSSVNQLAKAHLKLSIDKKSVSFLPYFTWHGNKCQFHLWLKKTLSGDFGISYRTLRPVQSEIEEAVYWTFLMNGIALFLVFLLGIPLGLKAAEKYQQLWDKRLLGFTFVSDAIPTFWIATLLVIFFTSNYYGIKIFPSVGIGNQVTDASFWKKMMTALPHFIAPILCIVFTSISLIIKQVRASSLAVRSQDFVRTAKAKGLSSQQIAYRHVLPNALFPLITLLGTVLPELITGAVTIEMAFNIQGMGKLAVSAIDSKDFPILIAIVLLLAFFSVLGNLIADILYRFFDPRIKI